MADKNQVLGRKGRVEREQRYNNIVIFSSIAVISTIVLVLVVGFVVVGLIQPQQPILEVNDETITTKYFQERVSLSRYLLIQQYSSTFEYLMQFGAQSPQLVTQFDQQLQLIEFQLTSSFIGQSTIDLITEAILVREAADDLGIVITDEDIIREIESNFGYFPDGQPEPTATMLVAPASTLSATQLAIVTLTPTQEEVVVPTAEEVEDGAEAPTAAPTFETPPTATIIPTAEFGAQLDEDMKAIAKAINADADVLREFFIERLYRDKVYEIITADVSAEEEMVWAQHILVATEEEAQLIYEALQDGADWSEQAALFSIDTSNNFSGGSLGWFNAAMMVPEFAAPAFAAEIGVITKPVQSDFGWHLIQVVGHEMRPLDAQQTLQAKDAAFAAWLDAEKAEASITVYDYWTDRVPTTPAVDYEILQQVDYIRQQLSDPTLP